MLISWNLASKFLFALIKPTDKGLYLYIACLVKIIKTNAQVNIHLVCHKATILFCCRNRPHVMRQLDEMDDYRPYFTYWVTSVQASHNIFNSVNVDGYRSMPVFKLDLYSILIFNDGYTV